MHNNNILTLFFSTFIGSLPNEELLAHFGFFSPQSEYSERVVMLVRKTCISLLFGVIPCLGLGVSPLYARNGDAAKKHFCVQKYFDSLSFDGESYKFTVNRKTRNTSLSWRYTFEEFKLKFSINSDSFHYSSSTFDYHDRKCSHTISIGDNLF